MRSLRVCEHEEYEEHEDTYVGVCEHVEYGYASILLILLMLTYVVVSHTWGMREHEEHEEYEDTYVVVSHI
jgi:hypothetical protein